MARLTLPRIAPTRLQFELDPPTFSHTVAADLGEHGTAADGFDPILNSAITHLAEDFAALPELDKHIAAAEFREGEFHSQNYAPAEEKLGKFLAAGDGITAGFSKAVGKAPTGVGFPLKAPIPIPPGTGRLQAFAIQVINYAFAGGPVPTPFGG